MSLFFVDSGCDFSAEQLKKMAVEALNLPYSLNEKKLNIDEEFDLVKFYSKVRKDVVLTTESPSVEEYINIFAPIFFFFGFLVLIFVFIFFFFFSFFCILILFYQFFI